MFAFIAKRLVSFVVVLLVLSLIIFGATQILPGNVANAILGTNATPESVAALEEQLGLNEPLWKQYLTWLGNFVTGDWGESLRLQQEIRPLLLFRMLNSTYLAAAALLGIVVFGIGLGIVSAIRQNSPSDHAISVVALLGISTPAFVLASLLIIIFSGGVWNVLPASGYESPTENFGGWMLHLVLPTITLMSLLLAYVIRMTRSSMIEVLGTNYVRTARLKGAPEQTVILRHALRNALLPTVTVIAMNIGWILGSVVIIEEVFAYPGVGSLMVDAVQNRDLPLLQAAVMVIGTVTMVANFAADLAYAYLNPRIRYR
jgi:peptide/nickel transport system permease protein